MCTSARLGPPGPGPRLASESLSTAGARAHVDSGDPEGSKAVLVPVTRADAGGRRASVTSGAAATGRGNEFSTINRRLSGAAEGQRLREGRVGEADDGHGGSAGGRLQSKTVSFALNSPDCISPEPCGGSSKRLTSWATRRNRLRVRCACTLRERWGTGSFPPDQRESGGGSPTTLQELRQRHRASRPHRLLSHCYAPTRKRSRLSQEIFRTGTPSTAS